MKLQLLPLITLLIFPSASFAARSVQANEEDRAAI